MEIEKRAQISVDPIPESLQNSRQSKHINCMKPRGLTTE